MKKGGRARQITTGRALQEEDDKTRSVRLQPDNESPGPDVDYYRLWKRNREDGSDWWQEFLKVQERLCPECRTAFNEACLAANKKVFGDERAVGRMDGEYLKRKSGVSSK